MATVEAAPFVYAHRTNGVDGLSDAWLKQRLPSVFATRPIEGVSDKYGFLPTTTILSAMRKEGFVPVEARHYMRRNTAKVGFTKHMLRFRVAGEKPQVVGDCVPQIIVVNSHDRSSRAELYGGLWRLICGNGLMVSESGIISPVIVRHLSNPVESLLSNVEGIIKQFAHINEHVKEMRSVKLTEKQQLALAREALELRNPRRTGIILPETLLRARRTQDQGDDLWRVFNRLQENMTKGGLEGLSANGRPTITRPVESMRNDMRFNSGLWEIAMNAIAKARGTAAKETKAKA